MGLMAHALQANGLIQNSSSLPEPESDRHAGKFLQDDEVVFYPKAPDDEELKQGNDTCTPSDAD